MKIKINYNLKNYKLKKNIEQASPWIKSAFQYL